MLTEPKLSREQFFRTGNSVLDQADGSQHGFIGDPYINQIKSLRGLTGQHKISKK